MPSIAEIIVLANLCGGGASSWNDLKDKPFYTESVTVVPEQRLTNCILEQGGLYGYQFDVNFNPEQGVTYILSTLTDKSMRLLQPKDTITMVVASVLTTPFLEMVDF